MDGWTVKLFAGIALTLAGAVTGRVFADAKKRRADQLSKLCQAIERLPVVMLERRMPLDQALSRVGHEGFNAVSRAMKSERSADMAWKASLGELRAKDGELSALEDDEIEILNGMFSSLGLSGAAEQRILLDGTREALSALYDKARKKADEQAKLYSTLGLLTGLAVAILLI